MVEHRYILEPYKQIKKKYVCPSCGHSNKFVHYIDSTTNERLESHVGRCERIDNCGYNFTPKMFFDKNPVIKEPTYKQLSVKKASTPKPSYIDYETLKSTMKCYSQNMFVEFLNQAFGAKTTQELIDKYLIGTSKHWNGSTIFWQVDNYGNVRGGKIMKYEIKDNPDFFYQFEPKRRKDIQWVHTLTKIENYNLSQCLFGLHLLDSDKNKPVAIVESEKTAIIASVYFPQYLWLASGGAEGLNIEKIRALKNRKVLLFPDCNKFSKWQDKAKSFRGIINVKVSELLEENANEMERQNGIDLADWLLGYDYRDFLDPIIEPIEVNTKVVEVINENILRSRLPSGWYYQEVGENYKTLCNENGFPANWSEPKDKAETLALMIDKNANLELLIERLDCKLL